MISYFNCLLTSKCSVTAPHGTVGCSEVCNCGIS